MVIMMRSEMGWITKCIRSDCRRVKVVLPCVELLVYWKAIEGTATLISSENPRILSVQSLEAHHRVSEYSLDDTVEGLEPLPAYLVDETPLGTNKTMLMEVPVEELVFDSDGTGIWGDGKDLMCSLMFVCMKLKSLYIVELLQ